MPADRPQPGKFSRGRLDNFCRVLSRARHWLEAQAEETGVAISFQVRAGNGELPLAAVSRTRECVLRVPSSRKASAHPHKAPQRPVSHPPEGGLHCGPYGSLVWEACEECDIVSEGGVAQSARFVEHHTQRAHHNDEEGLRPILVGLRMPSIWHGAPRAEWPQPGPVALSCHASGGARRRPLP